MIVTDIIKGRIAEMPTFLFEGQLLFWRLLRETLDLFKSPANIMKKHTEMLACQHLQQRERQWRMSDYRNDH